MGQKRQRDSKSSGFQSKKRKRAANDNAAADANDGWDGIVGADELNWTEVALPDRLEDAGGFFGLEEIEGVDIVRNPGNGEVRFKAKAGKPKKSVLKTKAPEEEETTHDDEWSGFSDNDTDAPETKPSPAVEEVGESDKKVDLKEAKEANKKDKKKEAKQLKKEQKEKGSAIQHDSSIKAGMSFAALQDAEEDDGVDVSAWDALNLSTELLTGISKMKFTSPTAVQAACIPHILDGHDVVGKASTGSGKTLAFGIPILEHYLEKNRDGHGDIIGKKDKKDSTPIALILSPTRELAHQLAKHIGELVTQAPGVNARIALLTGGLSVQKQQRLLAGADIVIGTPGRVWEIMSTGQGLIRKMQKIKFLVVDEADRLLSEGHFKEVEEIIGALDRVEDGDVLDEEDEAPEEESDPRSERQTLVFSATFHRDLQQKLAGKGKWTGGDIMNKKESMDYLLQKLNFREEKPKFIDTNPVSQMAENLKEGIVECGAMEKDLFLYTLLLYHPKHRTLVFTNSISAVRRLAQLLQALQLPALALHSSMAQKARLRSVERFSSPTANPGTILIATDVAARGLDIKGIDLVIHYHAPRTADTYVHRSGRTARAGASGKSVIICGPDEMVGVVRLAAKVHANMANGKRLPLESLELDRRVVGRVKPRVSLASRIVDANIAKEKISSEDNWLRNAAEDLGVEYDSEEFDEAEGKGRGRGRGRQQKQKEAGSVSKAELAGLRAELKQLLSQRVNVGVSERYLTAGRVDIEALLRGEGNASFLGPVDPLGF
ncbi:ATP-dependent RNA helicase MAK5 [Aspergillus clavatus NRRL 1]|uniref:ATP-dependent RNA helicase mak5 n=1 Tax=Aspergillus clavatus (strain ATCC 1007 / CBS 513.65 / DSM 816 / NCTC 3887 / NRRL 1 / QM 1276 / 107) TaxID=344612 RepID=MAK5_ASPCL|nr:ATP dependent RNA helicase, putative [Aspergillus clavatus NRRL 1]A1CTL8.1 RecName: Full=ATP-dependent RNA helicase mak5 [Aspergillus clavatus NRRL 1]EAW06655.1 ATP dependent RNA helicase, putative [Aspergillus clavatus NRRL 1]